MILKHIIYAVTGTILLTCVTSCHEHPILEMQSCELTFSLDGASTKATGIVASNESRIDHWTVFIFNTANPAEFYRKSSATGGSISVHVGAGKSYRAYAIVNYPQYGSCYFDPVEVNSEENLKLWISDLSGNQANSLVMFGTSQLGSVSSDITRSISVSRLVSKVGIMKITRNFSDSNQAARTFAIKKIYLTNVFRTSFLSRDYFASEVLPDDELWYNAGGYHASGTIGALDDLTADASLNVTLANGSSYTTAHYFYAFPNTLPAGTDPRGASWSPRHTRLVIEAQIGSGTYYYPVTIPTMARNNTYVITEATIRNLGSLDPEEEIPGAIDVTFSSSTDLWEGNYSITEYS